MGNPGVPAEIWEQAVAKAHLDDFEAAVKLWLEFTDLEKAAALAASRRFLAGWLRLDESDKTELEGLKRNVLDPTSILLDSFERTKAGDDS